MEAGLPGGDPGGVRVVVEVASPTFLAWTQRSHDFPSVSRKQAVAALEQAKEALLAQMRVLLDECLPRKLKL